MTTAVKGIVAKYIAKLLEDNQFEGVNGFSQGVNMGITPRKMVFDPNSWASLNLLNSNFGWLSSWSDANAGIMYGFASNVTRTGGSMFTVGGQFSGYAANNTVTGATFGVVSQAWNRPGAATDIVGGEPSIINETSSLTSAKIGWNVVFKDRPDGQANVTNGIASNAYNTGSMGLFLSSQARSGSGENCGWKKGIYFDIDAMDGDVNGGAIGIDFASVRVVGALDPLTAYRMTAAIRFRDFQSILWNGDPSLPGNPTEPTNPVREYFDSVTSEMKWTNSGALFHGLNVGNGDVRVKQGGRILLDGNTNAANLQYDVTNSRFAFDNAGVHQFAVDVADGSLYMRHGALLKFEGTTGGATLSANVSNPGTLGLKNAFLVIDTNFGLSFSTGSAQVQPTVGAAGVASALPGAPYKYLVFYIDGVTKVVVPCWPAA